MDTVIKSVLMRIKALGKIGITGGAIVQKFRAYLEDVAVEFRILLIGYFVCFVLVYNKNIVVIYLVNLSADKEGFAAREAEKELATIVDMYIGVRISLLGVVYAKASVVAGVGYSLRAAFKNVVHFMVSLSWSGKLVFIVEFTIYLIVGATIGRPPKNGLKSTQSGGR